MITLYTHAEKLTLKKVSKGRYELTDPAFHKANPPRLVATLYLDNNGWAADAGPWADDLLPGWHGASRGRYKRQWGHRHEAISKITADYLEWAKATEPLKAELQAKLDHDYLTPTHQARQHREVAISHMSNVISALTSQAKRLERIRDFAKETKGAEGMVQATHEFTYQFHHYVLTLTGPRDALLAAALMALSDTQALCARAKLTPERAQALDDEIIRQRMAEKLTE